MARTPPPRKPSPRKPAASAKPSGADKPSTSAKPEGGKTPDRRGPGRPYSRHHPRPEAAPVPPNLPTYADAVSIVLRPGTATPVLAGHPWLFSGALAHIVPGPQLVLEPGVRCALFDQHARYLGVGYYNADSQIAVRMIAGSPDALEPLKLPDLADLVRLRLRQAAALRRDWSLPSATTDAYRLANSEGDALPGCTVDRFGEGASVQISTAGMWRLRAVIVAELRDQGCKWVTIRVPTDIHPSEGLLAGNVESDGPVPAQVQVRHNGLLLRVEPGGGQKTGMYCDQRDNHLKVAQLAAGRFVLDCFSHTGGFGLHAARAGAARVLCVDASQKAADTVLQHAIDNDLPVQAQCGDAVHLLRQMAELPPQERPSLVIIDPPKYATKGSAVDGALRKYRALNVAAMQAVQPGGWLVSCSCSGLVEPDAFLRMIGSAAHEAGVQVHLAQLLGPAPDHPTAPAHAEGRYLKVALVRVLAKA